MKQKIAEFLESYSHDELWFDDERKEFILHEAHWGLIDDELINDGQKVISSYEALQSMIEFNQLEAVLKYRKELQLEKNLDRVLANAKKYKDRYEMKFESDWRNEYYRLSENEYVVADGRLYYYVQNDEPATIDNSIVRRILQNPSQVIRSTYDRVQECWVRAPLAK